ncbi:hypothetical protein SAMN02787142_4451 [Burkholderia sp. WP9]|jgi:hypothetical protein|nr:hypothetical protein SAMN02787142_4451 [Burkholderia sp. WP9]
MIHRDCGSGAGLAATAFAYRYDDGTGHLIMEPTESRLANRL